MKKNLLLITLAFSFISANAQDFKERTNKGRIYASYGLNRTSYDLSNLKLKGDGYNFSLTHFDANDGFSEYDFAKFNAKLGFFITEHLSISVGYDNFTYKSFNNKLVKIGGNINWGEYAADYKTNEDVIRMKDAFLSYEYTKLEYINLNLEVNDDFWVSKNGKSAWSYYFGIGGGVILTQSQVSLFKLPSSVKENGMTGFGGNASFGTRFYLGPVFLELGGKAGYMKSKNVVSDEFGGLAEHDFMFASGIASIGLSFNLTK
jgi:hypothetical protein